MADFYEIDFLEVHKERSGDAISMRYEQYGLQSIQVADVGVDSTIWISTTIVLFGTK